MEDQTIPRKVEAIPITPLMSCRSIANRVHNAPREEGKTEQQAKRPRGQHQVLPSKGNKIRGCG